MSSENREKVYENSFDEYIDAMGNEYIDKFTKQELNLIYNSVRNKLKYDKESDKK